MPAASTASPPGRFALTKIQPPRLRTDLVDRPSLHLLLQAALCTRRLVLLLAPAGYGKTVALTQQIRQAQRGGEEPLVFSWISADENDQLQRFLECLGAAVEPHDLAWRMAPEALATLALSEHGLRDAAGEFVNALAGADVARGLIVIDDAHRIADPRVWAFLQAVLDHLPPAWGLVVASRLEPPLRLARLRAADELAEFGRAELRFDETAVQALLARLPGAGEAGGEGPAPRRATELLERTDGWPVGLRLSLSVGLKNLVRPGFSVLSPGDPAARHVFDYLTAEVLDEMPQRLREFLLRCSILPEMSAARCAQVSGDAQAAELLDQIERRGAFVSVLETQDLTLRLHDLFRDFLQDRLARERPEELPALLRRAAAGEGDLARAFAYLARAGAWDEAARALLLGGPALLARGGGPSVERMLTHIPPEAMERLPDMHLLRGLVAFNGYDWEALLQAMQTAARLYAAAGQGMQAAMARTYACAGLHHVGRIEETEAELAALRAMPLPDSVRADVCYISAWHEFSRERSEGVAPQLSALLDTLMRLPGEDRWYRSINLCLFVGLPGMHPVLERLVEQIPLDAAEPPTLVRAGALHSRAALALECGDLAGAWRWAQRGDADDRWLGMPSLLSMHNSFIKILMLALRGEGEACREAIEAAWEDTEQCSTRSHRLVHGADLLIAAVRAAWILGDEVLLRRMDEALQRAENRFEWLGAARCRSLSCSFIALTEGRSADAVGLLTPLADDVNRHMFFPATQARVMLACVQLELGEPDAAAAALRPWLQEASETGLFGGGLLAGPRMVARLADADWGTRLPQKAVQMLGRMAAQFIVAPPVPAPVSDSVRAALGPRASLPTQGNGPALSSRECEVLARIAAGDSNKLIARAFALSPHTVKRHVANILDKTGARSRGEAASWFRERR